MLDLPDPEWYLDNVLVFAEPGGPTRLLRGAAASWQRWWERQITDDEPMRTAAGQGFVVSTDQLRSLGISRGVARHAADRGRWSVPQRGFVAPLRLADNANAYTVRRRVQSVAASAMVLSRPGLVVSARSAAILRGLPTLAVPQRPECTIASDRYGDRLGRRPTRHTYGASLGRSAIGSWFGVPCTTVERTLVDLARHGRRDGLVAADAAMHEGLAGRDTLDKELEDAVGWPGVRQAREVLALADGRAESPLETLVRLALHDSGFPPPELQVSIGGYRVDMLWPEQRLIVEVDGLAKYSDESWRREKRREQVLRALGYRVERVTWDDLHRRWPATVARLRRELHL